MVMGVVLFIFGGLVLIIGIGIFAGAKSDFTIGVDEGVKASAMNVLKHMISEKEELQKKLTSGRYSQQFCDHMALVLAASADERMVNRYPTC